MLNFPRTGSSFARKVLKRLYIARESRIHRLLARMGICNPSVMDVKMPKIDEDLDYKIKDQHGTLRQIPREHRSKPTVSIARSPFSRYLSLYSFRWWEKYPPVECQKILEQYPHFPNLSFSEYYEMTHVHGRKNRLHHIVPKVELGFHTIQFIQFYFKDPEATLNKINDNYIDNEQFRDDMGAITFLHQENLNSELKEFLLRIGMKQKELQFIDSMEKVNVTEKKEEEVNYREFYSYKSIAKKVLEREKLLFKIFPEYLPIK
jgi:hypothetical protein